MDNQAPLHILLTNDDGHSAPGIQILRDTLKRHGYRVTLVAPSGEQSATSMSTTMNRALALVQTEDDSWHLDAAPAEGISADQLEPVRFGTGLAGRVTDAVTLEPVPGAEIRVVGQPAAPSVSSEDDGTFELDLPPGDYEVTVTVKGFKEQTRQIHIDEEGVTIMNVDLRK